MKDTYSVVSDGVELITLAITDLAACNLYLKAFNKPRQRYVTSKTIHSGNKKGTKYTLEGGLVMEVFKL